MSSADTQSCDVTKYIYSSRILTDLFFTWVSEFAVLWKAKSKSDVLLTAVRLAHLQAESFFTFSHEQICSVCVYCASDYSRVVLFRSSFCGCCVSLWCGCCVSVVFCACLLPLFWFEVFCVVTWMTWSLFAAPCGCFVFHAGCLVSLVILRCFIVVVIACVCVCARAVCSCFVSVFKLFCQFVFLSVFWLPNFKKGDYKRTCDPLTLISVLNYNNGNHPFLEFGWDQCRSVWHVTTDPCK